jgi:predicted metal-dependent peptidase
MKSLKEFLYKVQEEKDAKKQKEMTSQFNDRKNILNLKIIVIVDVSGSISNEQYKSFMKALDKIKGMSMIKVIETDTVIVSMYDFFKNRKGHIFSFKGGGGTDFVKAFEAAERMNGDAICLLSDGDDQGNVEEPKVPVGVVVTKNGHSPYGWMEECSRVDH